MADSIEFKNDIDLDDNRVINGGFESLATDPASPVQGQQWNNTTNHRQKLFINGQAKSLAFLEDVQNLGTHIGGHDASTGIPTSVPTAIRPSGTIEAGDTWYITVAGTLTGIGGGAEHLQVGDMLKAIVSNPVSAADFIGIQRNLDDDNRVRPSFRDTGTVTGRLSCSQPNLQQLPKVNAEFPVDTRKCFIVPKGKTMVTCDYSGQEVAVAAEVSKDPTLIDALNKGQDMHLRIANTFYHLGIPEEALYTTNKEYEFYKKKFKTERGRAKTITFGFNRSLG